MMERKKNTGILPLCLAIVFSLLFVLLLVLVRTVDVAAIGPGGTSVGLSQINGSFHEWVDYNATWYQITKWLGLSMFALAAGVAFFSLWQWICRKSIWKVDKLLLATDLLYLVTTALYLLFNLVAVNYRPVLLEGQTVPVASFPSSHTLIACVVFGSSFWLIATYLRKGWRIAAWIGAVLLPATIVIGRMFSGVHWLTDIWAGLILAAALICWFQFAVVKLEKPQE